jgi:hypothetical protein
MPSRNVHFVMASLLVSLLRWTFISMSDFHNLGSLMKFTELVKGQVFDGSKKLADINTHPDVREEVE